MRSSARPIINDIESAMRQKFFAELIGTFALVFAGTGAIVVNTVTKGTITHPGIALTFGLVVMTMVYSFGPVSGAHFNPAVTAGFIVSGRLKWNESFPYFAGQLFGALAASLFLKLLFGDVAHLGASLPSGLAFQSFLLDRQ